MGSAAFQRSKYSLKKTDLPTHRGTVESLHNLGPFLDRHRTIQSNIEVPERTKGKDVTHFHCHNVEVNSLKVPSRSAQLFKEVQCLSVVGDKHHLVTSCSPRHRQDVVKNQHFPWNNNKTMIREDVLSKKQNHPKAV